eukprot:gene24296-29513_t
MPDRNANRQLMSALDREFYKNVCHSLVKGIEIEKMDFVGGHLQPHYA